LTKKVYKAVERHVIYWWLDLLYAVVFCPKCGKGRLVKWPFKSTKCFYCNRTLTEKNVVAKGLSREAALNCLMQLRLKRSGFKEGEIQPLD
jgi:hypothetical protein